MAEFGPEVLFILLIVPILLPNFTICIKATVHLIVDLARGEELIVVGAQFKLLKIVVLLQELIHFLLLLLVLNDSGRHFTLGARGFAIFFRDS